MADTDEAVEQRKKKIKELEAQLFGGGYDWNTAKTDLPELKNVDEYTSKYGHAEAKRPDRLPRLRTAPKKAHHSIFKPSLRKNSSKNQDTFDAIPLVDDDEEAEKYNDLFADQQQVFEPESRKKSSLGGRRLSRPLSKAQRLLKSEVDQLDEAFGKIFQEPKENVIENLKKRHGLLVKRKSHSDAADNYTQFDFDPTTVKSFTEKMNRAQILDRVQDRVQDPAALTPKDTLKVGRSPSLSRSSEEIRTRSPRSPGRTSERDLTIGGSRGDSRRRFSSDELSLSVKALPPISPRGTEIPRTTGHTPDIKIDPSPKQRRSQPVLQDTSGDKLTVTESKESNGRNPRKYVGMISYEGLEAVDDPVDSKTFDDLEDTFSGMPTNTFKDMEKDNSFSDIPTDIFDKIPRAVTAREERRMVKLQEQRLAQLKASATASNENENSTNNNSEDPPKVSFIAALFSSDNSGKTASDDKSGTDKAGNGDLSPREAEIVDKDFMFALFITQQEAGALSNSTPDLRTEATISRAKSARPSMPPAPDPDDPDVGHFCAPWADGFCESNYCIFHSPVKRAGAPATTTAAVAEE